jgi:hypothetical protein
MPACRKIILIGSTASNLPWKKIFTGPYLAYMARKWQTLFVHTVVLQSAAA